MMLANSEAKYLGEKQFYLKNREKTIPGIHPSIFNQKWFIFC
jgi:hypothetical protein